MCFWSEMRTRLREGKRFSHEQTSGLRLRPIWLQSLNSFPLECLGSQPDRLSELSVGGGVMVAAQALAFLLELPQ